MTFDGTYAVSLSLYCNMKDRSGHWDGTTHKQAVMTIYARNSVLGRARGRRLQVRQMAKLGGRWSSEFVKLPSQMKGYISMGHGMYLPTQEDFYDGIGEHPGTALLLVWRTLFEGRMVLRWIPPGKPNYMYTKIPKGSIKSLAVNAVFWSTESMQKKAGSQGTQYTGDECVMLEVGQMCRTNRKIFFRNDSEDFATNRRDRGRKSKRLRRGNVYGCWMESCSGVCRSR